MQKFKVVSVDDSSDTCECCGRRGLKKVVGLLPLDVDGGESGAIRYYGAVCAARACGWTYTKSDPACERRRAEKRAVAELRREKLAVVDELNGLNAAFYKHGLVVYVEYGFGRGFSCLACDPVLKLDRATLSGDDIRAARERLENQFPLLQSYLRLSQMSVSVLHGLLAAHREIIASYCCAVSSLNNNTDPDVLAGLVLLFPVPRFAHTYRARFGATALRNLLDQHDIDANDPRRVVAAAAV